MRKISILYDGSFYTFRWLKPLIWARKELKEKGYIIEFASLGDYLPYYKSNSNIIKSLERKQFDIILMAFHHSGSSLGLSSSEERSGVLQIAKEHCKKLIWMDTADSTGTCLFDVMPFVDIYMKKQINKDKSVYLNDYYGGCSVYQYYHDKYNIEDNLLTRHFPPARQEDLKKMRISWSIGLSDIFTKYKSAFIRPANLRWPRKAIIDFEQRKYDVFYHGYSHSDIIGWQRHKCCELLDSYNDFAHTSVYEIVSSKQYQSEFHDSRSAVSPFGWGEVCFRDFEAFANEAVLIKPDMSHCETYPDVFIEGETYVPVDWDLSNLKGTIEDLKANVPKAKKIAQNGKDLYLKYFAGKEAKRLFAEHFVNQI